METHLWICPWGCFQKDVTESGRSTLNVGNASHGWSLGLKKEGEKS